MEELCQKTDETRNNDNPLKKMTKITDLARYNRGNRWMSTQENRSVERDRPVSNMYSVLLPWKLLRSLHRWTSTDPWKKEQRRKVSINGNTEVGFSILCVTETKEESNESGSCYRDKGENSVSFESREVYLLYLTQEVKRYKYISIGIHVSRETEVKRWERRQQ